jgi:CsoR family transcriptional regulator, copper-sensing transcriptional repressor
MATPIPPHGGGGDLPMPARHSPPDPSAKDKILTRLRSAEGHLRGVVQMVEDDGYCIDVLRQTKAVHAALSKVEALLLDRHLHHCVTRAVRSDRADERARIIAELLDIFQAKKGNDR